MRPSRQHCSPLCAQSMHRGTTLAAPRACLPRVWGMGMGMSMGSTASQIPTRTRSLLPLLHHVLILSSSCYCPIPCRCLCLVVPVYGEASRRHLYHFSSLLFISLSCLPSMISKAAVLHGDSCSSYSSSCCCCCYYYCYYYKLISLFIYHQQI